MHLGVTHYVNMCDVASDNSYVEMGCVSFAGSKSQVSWSCLIGGHGFCFTSTLAPRVMYLGAAWFVEMGGASCEQ